MQILYGLTLILTLAVVGGAIAYIGDRLGMNVGRKKLTLFGLRPKHTSILVTIVTGVLIATASIGVLSIASQDVRTALFSMKEIQEELRGLQDDYEVMRGQRDTAQMELQEAEEKLTVAEQSYAQIIAELAEAESTVLSLQAEAVLLEARTQELRDSYDLVETAFGQIRGADIAFNASEVILTTVIRKGLGRAEVRATLEHFMKEVDEVAYRRSARDPESDSYRAIYLPPGVLDFAVEDVLLAPGDVIVRAVSEGNTIPGVPVRVYLENFPDQMVFSRGTVLASSTWDPASGVEIDLVILQILSQANNAALNAGVAISRERGAAVLLPGDEFFDAIIASREIEKPVQIRLVVAKDSWRSTSPVELYVDIMH